LGFDDDDNDIDDGDAAALEPNRLGRGAALEMENGFVGKLFKDFMTLTGGLYFRELVLLSELLLLLPQPLFAFLPLPQKKLLFR
jgi:hypothetical protein